jgi:branched-subunit amino acid ABC-type transport system permease component
VSRAAVFTFVIVTVAFRRRTRLVFLIVFGRLRLFFHRACFGGCAEIVTLRRLRGRPLPFPAVAVGVLLALVAVADFPAFSFPFAPGSLLMRTVARRSLGAVWHAHADRLRVCTARPLLSKHRS